jgi:hypothetical protein
MRSRQLTQDVLALQDSTVSSYVLFAVARDKSPNNNTISHQITLQNVGISLTAHLVTVMSVEACDADLSRLFPLMIVGTDIAHLI